MSKPKLVTAGVLASLVLSGAAAHADNQLQSILRITDVASYPSGVVGHSSPGAPPTWALYGYVAPYLAISATVSYIYKLTPPAPGLYLAPWTKTILYQDPSGKSAPYYGLPAFDRAGAMYAAKIEGYYSGVILKLLPPASSGTTWSAKTIFAGPFDFQPTGGVLVDGSGSLYGTSERTPYPATGFPTGIGVVFQLTPPSNADDSYAYHTLYTFTGGADGGYPYGPLVMDRAGNLFGATTMFNPGTPTIFELSPPAAGGTSWAFHVIYSYGSSYFPSYFPVALDPAGNVYINTVTVTDDRYYFTLSELSPPAAGGSAWTRKVLTSLPDQAKGLDVVAGDVIVTMEQKILQLAPPAVGSSTWTLSTMKDFTGTKDHPIAETRYAVDSKLNLYGGYTCNSCGYSGAAFKLYRTPK